MSMTAVKLDYSRKYCYTCGKQIIRQYSIVYYEETGKPVYDEFRTCPYHRRLWPWERHPVTASDAYVCPY